MLVSAGGLGISPQNLPTMISFVLQLATSPPTAQVPDSNLATVLLLGAGALGLGIFARLIKNRRK